MPDPTPDRWGHALIMLAMAELGESRLDPAIDAFDEARALGTGPAARIGEITASGPVHDRLVIADPRSARGGRWRPRNLDGSRKLGALRQVPEGRLESSEPAGFRL